MKKLFLSLILCLSSSISFASFTGLDLENAANLALAQASFEVGADNIIAWEVIVEPAEVFATVLDQNDLKIGYGCDNHGSTLVCHEEGEIQGTVSYQKDALITLDFLKSGNKEALTKFAKTLARRGLDLSIVESYKVWFVDDHQFGGHSDGADVWTKVTYEVAGQDKETFIQCHIENGDTDFSCHYQANGKKELDLDFGDHDGHHEHNH